MKGRVEWEGRRKGLEKENKARHIDEYQRTCMGRVGWKCTMEGRLTPVCGLVARRHTCRAGAGGICPGSTCDIRRLGNKSVCSL
jgi:hypothetical protein